MKKQSLLKPFKRKTASVKYFPVDEKINLPLDLSNRSEKYLSPKKVAGLDTCFYRKE